MNILDFIPGGNALQKRIAASLIMWLLPSLLLIVLKCFGITDWDWAWCVAPLFVLPLPYVVVFVVASIWWGLASFYAKIRK